MISYVDIFFIIITVLMVIAGARKGFLVSIIGVMKIVVSFPIAYLLSTTFKEAFYELFLKNSITNTLRDKLTEAGSIESFVSDMQNTLNGLPFNIGNSFDVSGLKSMTTGKVVSYIESNFIRPIGIVISEIIIFWIVASVILIIFSIVIFLVGKKRNKRDKSAISRIDRVLGGVLGIVQAVVFVGAISFCLDALLDIFGDTATANEFITQLKESKILGLVNDITKMIA